jgi:hypothetical protein
MNHHVTENGECIEFTDVIDITEKISKSFGLSEIAKHRAIDMSLTLDGSQLTNKLSFVMAGLKLVDLAVRNPITGEYKLDPNCEGSTYLPQSRKWCFPLKFCMGKETTAMYQDEFQDLFDIFVDASKPGQKVFSGWEPIHFSNPADMAAIQKVLGIGGAAKVMTFFCHCCSLTSSEIAVENSGDAICDACRQIQMEKSDWLCYCQPFCSQELIGRYKVALNDLMNQWSHDTEKVRAEGKLVSGAENNPRSITYVPNTMDDTMAYSRLLIKEMRLRRRSTLRKTLNQLQSELKECLAAEMSMNKLISRISQAKTREEAMERIMTFVPCIMHCENRVGIKILTMIFIEGLSNYQGAKFADLDDISNLKREEIYINKVEKIVRGSILGSYGSEAQWSLPVEKQKNTEDNCRKIGTISMENYKVRKCINQIDQLIQISITEEYQKQYLKFTLNEYTGLIKIMRKKMVIIQTNI